MATLKSILDEVKVNGGNLPGVYKITRKSDGKIYIGQSISIVDRIAQHIKNEKVDKDSNSIDAAIQKEGMNSFTYEVLLPMPDATTAQLWYLEQMFIDKYNSCNNGFNKTQGNHKHVYDLADYRRKNVVPVELVKEIENQYNIHFNKDMSILLVHDFTEKFIDYLTFIGVKYTIINKYTEDKNELGEYIIEELDKMSNQHFDLIISNPPYGKIGANITKKIIDEIDFKNFINLLPANDYKRNDSHDLFKYVDINSMKPISNGFEDAAVTTHIAKINKKSCMYISWDEFQIENYIDDSLKKYFYENLNRKNVFEDIYLPSRDYVLNNQATTAIFSKRDVSHKHLPYSKKCNSYKWNKERSISAQYLIEHTAVDFNNSVSIEIIKYNTENEKNNFCNFIYSTNGFKFISKLFTAVNVDSRYELTRVFPKVDWTREWTVEEILKDYGYTEKEIKEVIDDLVNFKGMEE